MVVSVAIQRMADRWLEWMLAMSWQVAVLAGAVWVLCVVTRRASPRFRYALWCLVLVKLCLTPSLAFVTGIGQWLPSPTPVRSEGPPVQPAAATVSQQGMHDPPLTLVAEDAASAVGKPVSAQPLPRRSPAVTWSVALFAVWAAGVVAMAVILLGACSRLRRRLRRSAAVDDPAILSVLDEARAALDVRGRVELLAAEDLESPILFGLLRPRIVLPLGAMQKLSLRELKPILLHELAHQKRLDLWLNWAQAVLLSVYWFHPVVWLASLRLRRERELIVDDLVLSHLDGQPSAYGSSLLSVVKQARRRRLLAPGYVGIVETDRSISQRIRRILDPRRRLSLRLGWASIAVLIALALVLIPQARPGEGLAKKVEPAGTQAPKGQSDARSRFVFRIRTLSPDGKPQAGVKVRCSQRQRGTDKMAVDMVAESGADGIAEFQIGRSAKVQESRQLRFSLADESFLSRPRYGVRLTPAKNEREGTLRVLPTHAFRVEVVGALGPIPGAELWFTGDDLERGPKPTEFQANAGVVADTTGRATVRLARVKTRITVSARGYAPAFIQGVVLPADRPYQVKLVKGYQITGRVVDEEGKPVSGLTVEARRWRFAHEDHPWFMPRSTTDAEGRFEMAHVAAGRYRIVARPDETADPLCVRPVNATVNVDRPTAEAEMLAMPGAVLKGRIVSAFEPKLLNQYLDVLLARSYLRWRIQTSDDGSFVAAGIPPKTQGLLTFGGGAGNYKMFTVPPQCAFLEPEPDTLLFRNVPPGVYDGIEVRIVRAAKVKGVVRDAAGDPVANARVNVRPTGRSLTTNERGQYAFQIPPDHLIQLRAETDVPGSGELRGEAPSFTASEGDIVEKDITVAPHTEATDRETPKTGSGDDRATVAQPPGCIRGEVIDEVTEQPITAFNVRLRRPTDARKPGEPRASFPASLSFRGQDYRSRLGTFTLERLICRAPHTVIVSAKGYAPTRVERVIAKPLDSEDWPVVIRLRRGSGLAGTVRAAGSGKPVADAEVFLFRSTRESVYRMPIPIVWLETPGSSRATLRKTRTDEQGHFIYESVDEYGYPSLVVRAVGYGLHVQKEVDPGRPVQVSLPRGGKIVGNVKGLVERAQAHLSFGRLFNEYYVPIQPDGTFHFDYLPPGRHHVSVGPWGVDVTLREGETMEAAFPRPKVFRISGTVADWRGPVADVSVRATLHSRGFDWAAGAETDQQGQYVIEGAPAGDYKMEARKGFQRGVGLHPPWSDCELSVSDADVIADIRLHTVKLSGRVLDGATDRPVPNIWIYPHRWPESVRDIADIRVIPRKLKSGGVSWVRLAADDCGRPELGLRDTRCLDRVVYRSPWYGCGHTDSDGRFEITNLPRGRYSLHYARATQCLSNVSRPITIPDRGEIDPVVLRVVHSHSLCLRVVDRETKEPLPGATVHLHTADGQGLALQKDMRNTFQTGPDGVVRFGTLEPKKYSARVFAQGYIARWARDLPAVPTKSETDPLTVELRPTGTLLLKPAEGILDAVELPSVAYQIRDEAGRIVFPGGEHVYAHVTETGFAALVGSNAEGYTVGILAPGRYTVRWELHRGPKKVGKFDYEFAPAICSGTAGIEIRKGQQHVLILDK